MTGTVSITIHLCGHVHTTRTGGTRWVKKPVRTRTVRKEGESRNVRLRNTDVNYSKYRACSEPVVISTLLRQTSGICD